ncbi:MAG: hypothetical protein ABW069_20645, partial [Duganella sp.]
MHAKQGCCDVETANRINKITYGVMMFAIPACTSIYFRRPLMKPLSLHLQKSLAPLLMALAVSQAYA